jgi:hypothetical protein
MAWIRQLRLMFSFIKGNEKGIIFLRLEAYSGMKSLSLVSELGHVKANKTVTWLQNRKCELIQGGS